MYQALKYECVIIMQKCSLTEEHLRRILQHICKLITLINV